MPFLNEAPSLPRVLDSLAQQDIERERLFLIAIDSGSDDGGDDIVRRWLADTGIAGLVARAPKRGIPQALNAGLACVAADDIVVRLDSHTLYDRHYLSTLVRALATVEDEIWCVGGAPLPAPGEDFKTALGEAFYSNPMALGPADFRGTSEAGQRVSTVYLGAFRAGVLQRLGGWDERWEANEDCELSERIMAAGGFIARVDVRCGVITTRGPLATVLQRARYGYWRMQTFKRFPGAVRPRHIVPPAILLASPFVFWRSARGLFALAMIAYALATVAGRRSGEAPAITLASLIFFPAVQCAYAAGLIVGLMHTPAAIRHHALGE